MDKKSSNTHYHSQHKFSHVKDPTLTRFQIKINFFTEQVMFKIVYVISNQL